MRLGVWAWVAILLVQLSGLRALCVSGQRQTHPCCPVSGEKAPSSSVPECCLAALVNCQGLISEAPGTYNSNTQRTAQPLAAPQLSPALVLAITRPTPKISLPSVSPPLSPLSQSCLLLI